MQNQVSAARMLAMGTRYSAEDFVHLSTRKQNGSRVKDN